MATRRWALSRRERRVGNVAFCVLFAAAWVITRVVLPTDAPWFVSLLPWTVLFAVSPVGRAVYLRLAHRVPLRTSLKPDLPSGAEIVAGARQPIDQAAAFRHHQQEQERRSAAER